MGRVITLASQKGGSSKTTTASVLLATLPKSVGLDLDAQCNLTSTLAGDKEADANVCTILQGKYTVDEAIQHTSQGDIVTTSPNIWGLDLNPNTFVGIVDSLKQKYDYVVIDTPPTLTNLVYSALAVTELLIIPIEAASFSLDGALELCEVVRDMQSDNSNLKIGGLLVTQFNSRSNLRKARLESARELAESFKTRVFKNTIRYSVIIPEAQDLNQSIFQYAPKAKVTEDYKGFVDELKEVLKNG